MEKEDLAKSSDASIEKEGFISQSLSKEGIPRSEEHTSELQSHSGSRMPSSA